MDKLILEGDSPQRQHRTRLDHLLSSTTGPLRIASAYVTDHQLLKQAQDRERHLLLSLSEMDVVHGSTSLKALRKLIKSGVVCRKLPDHPRLHAKVYLFGSSKGVVTSANLTTRAFDSNLEAGIELQPEQVTRVTHWFDARWEIASPLRLENLSEMKDRTDALRHEYKNFRLKAKSTLKSTKNDKPSSIVSNKPQDLFDNARRYFVCNTCRRHSEYTPEVGFDIEEKMYSRGYAASWESFKYPEHMEQVEKGDIILMFAKRTGIIGIGLATGKCETLQPGDPDRVHNGVTPEWRIPVKWLKWEKDRAYAYPSPNFTFWDVTKPQYDELRKGVKLHFLKDA